MQSLKRISMGIFLLSFAFYAVAFNKVNSLPSSAEISADLSKEPEQIMDPQEPFVLNYRNDRYIIEPVATYDISGLIVTHNDITAFDDIYHSENDVDVRDLCLVWGSNVKDDVHLGAHYWSEPWACHYQPKSWQDARRFNNTKLSNSHLLVASERIRRQLLSLHPGDQVQLRGWLINYRDGDGNLIRNSSLSRKDTGNGACETMFVEELNVLGRYRPGWWKIRGVTAKVALFSLLAFIATALYQPLYRHRKEKEEVAERAARLYEVSTS